MKAKNHNITWLQTTSQTEIMPQYQSLDSRERGKLRLGERVAENDLEAEPVFALLENRYDTPLVEAEYQLEAAAADPVVAQALQVPARSPIFLIERTSYTTGNRPIDYERLHYRGDLIRFVTRLARRPSASMQG
jgi:GntR family transcriptional regulator